MLKTFVALLAFVAVANAASTGSTGAETGATGGAPSEALERADGSKGPLHPDFNVKSEVESAKREIKKTETHTLALSAKQKKLCEEEQAEFAKWLEQIDGNAAERAAEKAQREKAKEALSGALGDRIKQMEKFLNFLYGVRQQLGEHIYRTNRLYGGAYTAITYDIALTVEIMHDLGVMNNFHVSPIFHPIILPKKDKMDEEADKEKDEPTAATGAAAAATGAAAAPSSSNADPLGKNTEDKVSLMELTAHVHTGVKNCRDKEIAAGNVGDQNKGACSLGYNKAYELYNQGLAFTKFNHILFEQERVVLGTFRDRLKGMIARKEMRLKNMKLQLKKLEEAIANADKAVTVGSLLEGLKEHKTIIEKSCKDMQARTVIAQKELNDIYVALDKIKPLTMKDLTAIDDTKVGENKAEENKAEEKKADATPSSQTSSGDKLADNKADAAASGATGSDAAPEQTSQGTTVQ
jgi:hypothetical protein